MTVRSDSAIAALLPDNTSREISPSDQRDAFETSQARFALDIKQLGATGDGVTDDSTAVAAWLASLLSTGRPGYVSHGTYRVPNLALTPVTAALVITGAGIGRAIFDMEYDNSDRTTGILCWLELGNFPIALHGIEFRNFTNVIAGGDGNGITGVASSHYDHEDWRTLDDITGTVEGLRIEKCAFRGCRRPICIVIGDHLLPRELDGVWITDNIVDDCWGGFTLNGFGYRNVWIGRNKITNIDGEPAGLTAGGSAIRNFGTSRGIHLGSDRNSTASIGDPQRQRNRTWRVFDNVIAHVSDERDGGEESSPELHGTDIRCAFDVETSANAIKFGTIPANANTDTEGMHFRDCVDWRSTGDYIEQFGSSKEGALACKGTQRRGRITNLTLYCEDPSYKMRGILYTGPDLIIDGLVAVGLGDFVFNAFGTAGGLDKNISIRGFHVKDFLGSTVFNFAGQNGYYRLADGDIDGVTGALSASGNDDLVGISVSDGVKRKFDIKDIQFKNFIPAGVSIRNATYRWTASGSGTSEYYLELAAGGDPSITEPDAVWANSLKLVAGTVGSLTASQWDYGDNDTLGFNTIYVRLADSTDPDTKAADYVVTAGHTVAIRFDGGNIDNIEISGNTVFGASMWDRALEIITGIDTTTSVVIDKNDFDAAVTPYRKTDSTAPAFDYKRGNAGIRDTVPPLSPEHVTGVSGTLTQEAHGGQQILITGAVSAPVTDGFKCGVRNKSGGMLLVVPVSGSMIHEGQEKANINLPANRSVELAGDGTDVWVTGDLPLPDNLSLIDRTTGTNIGNLSAAGGLAASFDGDTDQDTTAGSGSLSVAAGYIGKTLAAASTIGRCVAYATNNQGFRSGTGNTRIRLFAKTAAAPASPTDGTELANSGLFTDGPSLAVALDSNDLATEWDHAWITISVEAGTDNFRLAELELYAVA